MPTNDRGGPDRQEVMQASPVDARVAILAIFEECAADPYGFVIRELEAHKQAIEAQRQRREVKSDD